MPARTTRIRLLAAASAAAAALVLTACGSGADDGAGRAGNSPAPGATAAPSAGTTSQPASTGAPVSPATGTPSGARPSTGKAATPGGAGGKSTAAPAPDSGAAPMCDGTNAKVTATVVARPLNHMLLTITNTGSKSCDLTDGYPAARFGEAQAVPPVDRNSKPQAVLRLAPGESGYSGVRLSSTEAGGGEHGYRATTLTVPFTNDTVAKVALPAGGVYVDTALQVTYWQSTLDDALN
ncbi:DUF4232 domain-containing protein [Yinghuangia soli]|uniref:DUF4232 domain-containing protein n=1 Tax=Yinghuangia soli TaxID=2908204 RepID=A0AA41Q0P8_9ACTN|nr:DUF4232 domain-containing protein [Yinghuangia soli]MCF2529414.1 DUF4232 domain-containing protein [Yinghuangia soli]